MTAMAIGKPVLARIKQAVISAGFGLFRSTGAHRLAARWTGGQGAILMMHRVRPWTGGGFAPNRLLEITPEFLEQTIQTLHAQDFDIVTMDEAMRRLRSAEKPKRRYAVLSFDDAYRDNLEYALPVLQKYQAPFIIYAVPGFADRSAGLWWVELEEAVQKLNQVEITAGGQSLSLSTSNDSEKVDSFNSLYWSLRVLPEVDMRAAIRALADKAGVNWQEITEQACMDWEQLSRIAADPLCTIGAHTMTHPMLAKASADDMHREMRDSREQLERRLNIKVRHFAYPVGDPGSAGPREFEAADELGFESAVTTRPGMVFGEHRDHCLALPRLSVNGNWQDARALEVLLSGAPFAVWNRGKKISVT